MDRRSFLGLLGAAAVSVALPEIWTPPTDLLPATIKSVARVSSPADCVLEIFLCGKSHFSEVATFDVIRPGGDKMLALAMNTFGGQLRWVALPGEELPAPLQFVYTGNMTVNIVGKLGDQYSWTVLEPEDEKPSPVPVIIPVTSTWDSHPALAPASVPDVFKRAWRLK